MPEQLLTNERIERLRTRGDARQNFGWANGETDYVGEYSLTSDDIPALMALAQRWVRQEGDDEPRSDDNSVYGPVHAWRALGQLRAVTAVDPLLGTLDPLHQLGDDWSFEEYPDVFGLIGPSAIPPLTAYLSNSLHGEYSRVCAASGLQRIAQTHPETRAEVVAILTAELARHQERLSNFNGFLLVNLLELNAVESAEAIERAFAADVIDPTIVGDWGDVRRKLGVPGLGLAPDKNPRLPTVREQIGWVDHSFDFGRVDPPEGKSYRDYKREARAKKKAERKNRKKNRKSR